jgi:hypothetical protein
VDRTEHAADELNEAIGPDVKIPGLTRPGVPPPVRKLLRVILTRRSRRKHLGSDESLGVLTKDVSTSAVPAESGGLGSAIYDDEEAASSPRKT